MDFLEYAYKTFKGYDITVISSISANSLASCGITGTKCGAVLDLGERFFTLNIYLNGVLVDVQRSAYIGDSLKQELAKLLAFDESDIEYLLENEGFSNVIGDKSGGLTTEQKEFATAAGSLFADATEEIEKRLNTVRGKQFYPGVLNYKERQKTKPVKKPAKIRKTAQERV